MHACKSPIAHPLPKITHLRHLHQLLDYVPAENMVEHGLQEWLRHN